MVAESIRDEQARLIREISIRANRLRYITELLEDRWTKGHPVREEVFTVPVVNAPASDIINENGRRKVTQK